jgi:hypothetical protein
MLQLILVVKNIRIRELEAIKKQKGMSGGI